MWMIEDKLGGSSRPVWRLLGLVNYAYPVVPSILIIIILVVVFIDICDGNQISIVRSVHGRCLFKSGEDSKRGQLWFIDKCLLNFVRALKGLWQTGRGK